MQKTLVNIDINTRSQITQTGEFVNRKADYVRIERASWSILCFQFYDRQVSPEGAIVLTPYPIENVSLELLVDNDFKTSTEVMIKSISSSTSFDETLPSESNMVNITGDWVDGGTADPLLGQISVRIYSGTERLEEEFEPTGKEPPAELKNCYLSLRQHDSEVSTSTPFVWIPVIPYNTILEAVPTHYEIPPTDVLTAALASYFSRPFLMGYAQSSDATQWHDTPTDDDNYMVFSLGADGSIPAARSSPLIMPKRAVVRYCVDDDPQSMSDILTAPNANTYFVAIINTVKQDSELTVSDFSGKWYQARAYATEPIWQTGT